MSGPSVVTVVVRTAGPPLPLAEALREALQRPRRALQAAIRAEADRWAR